MKYCPRCNQRYDDKELNFCLNDGELLVEQDTSDAPPTLYLDPPRTTRENWADHQTPQQPQGNQQIYPYGQQQSVYSAPSTNPATMAMQDKTLPTISLILGISSIVLMCCWLGIPLGAASVVTGFVGMNRTNQDPQRYGGRELAIVGMVLGGISFVLTFIMAALAFFTN